MLTDIQQKLLQLMKELDQVCRENGIHYTLGGGTAIGAIRHKGFIPWDDDIDLYMTRDNWEKFKAAGAAGKLPPCRVIESAETDIGYTNTIGRYVATDSSSVHSHQIIYNDPAGHVLDVFVFDPLNIRNYRRFIEDFMLYSDLMDETKGYSCRFDVNLNRYPKAFARCEAGQKEAVIGELVESFTHMDDPGWEHYIMEWGSSIFLFPRTIFDGGYIRIPFEDTTVEIVRNYSEYLTWQYGDEWMYVPQHAGREGHEAIFSNTIPYTVVRNDYMPFIDAKEVRKAYIRRKKRLLKANPHRRGAEKKEMLVQAEKCRDKLMKRIAEQDLNAADLRKMADEGRFGELSELFSDYYELQLSPEFSGRKDKHSKLRMYLMPVIVPIDTELAEIAVETLLRTERMSKAKRLIDVYTGCFDENIGESIGNVPGARLGRLTEEILETRALINDYYDPERVGRDELLVRTADALREYPLSSRIRRLRLRLLLEKDAGDGSVRSEIEELLAALETMHPQGTLPYGEVEFYKALYEDAGTGRFKEIHDGTANGCIQLEIRELLEAKDIHLEDPYAVDPETEDAGSTDTSASAVPPARKSRRSLYSAARSIYRKIAGRDDRLKERAWEIAQRTRDRVVLLERYENRLDELSGMMESGDWDHLSKEMAAHEEAVLRNLKLGLGLSVHPVLTAIQYELFRRTGRAKLADKVDSLVPEQHRTPIRG